MRAAISKAEIESEITSRFGSAFRPHEKRPAEVIATGISQIDSFTNGGLPRGAITEIFGPASSGRTSFMISALAHATRQEEVCALVDTTDGFDPKSAAGTKMHFERLLWIRCANNLEHAFKATDLLLQAGGFGFVVLDLGDVAAKSAKRIISSWWYRFRRTLEATPTALMVIAEDSCVKSCAALALELRAETCLWSSSEHARVDDSKTSAVDTYSIRPLPARPSLTSICNRPLKIDPQMLQISVPHSNLLKGLGFQTNCRRPLYFGREDEVFVKASSY